MKKQPTFDFLKLKIHPTQENGSLSFKQQENSRMSQHALMISQANPNASDRQIQNSFISQLNDNSLKEEQQIDTINKKDRVYKNFRASSAINTHLYVAYISRDSMCRFAISNDGTNRQVKQQPRTIRNNFNFEGNTYSLTIAYLQIFTAYIQNIQLEVYSSVSFCLCTINKRIDKLRNFLINYSVKHSPFVISNKYAKYISSQMRIIMDKQVRQLQAYLIQSHIVKIYPNTQQKENQKIQFLKILHPTKQIHLQKVILSFPGLKDHFLFFQKFLIRKFDINSFNQFMLKNKMIFSKFDMLTSEMLDNLSNRSNLQNERKQNLWLYKQIIYFWLSRRKYHVITRQLIGNLLNSFLQNCTQQQLTNFIKQSLIQYTEIFQIFQEFITPELIKLKSMSFKQFTYIVLQLSHKQRQKQCKTAQQKILILSSIAKSMISKYKTIDQSNQNQQVGNREIKKQFVNLMEPLFKKMNGFVFKQFYFVQFLKFVKDQIQSNSQAQEIYKIYLNINYFQIVSLFTAHLRQSFISMLQYILLQPINQAEISKMNQYIKKNNLQFKTFNQILLLFQNNKLTQLSFDQACKIMQPIYLGKQMLYKDYIDHIGAINIINSSKCNKKVKNQINQFIIKMINKKIFKNQSQLTLIFQNFHKIQNQVISRQYLKIFLVYIAKEEKKKQLKFKLFQLLKQNHTISTNQAERKILINYSKSHSQQQVYQIFQQIFKNRPQFLNLALKMNQNYLQNRIIKKLLNGQFTSEDTQLIFKNKQKIRNNLKNERELNQAFEYFIRAFSKLTSNVKILRNNLLIYSDYQQFNPLITKYDIYLRQTEQLKITEKLLFQQLTSFQNKFIELNPFYSKIKISKLWIQAQKNANITNIQDLVQAITNVYNIVQQKLRFVQQKNMSLNDFQKQFVEEIQQIFLLISRKDLIQEIKFVRQAKLFPLLQIQQFKIILQLLYKFERSKANKFIQTQDIKQFNKFIKQVKIQIYQYWRTQLQNNLNNFIQKLKDLQTRKTRILNSKNNKQISEFLQFIKILFQDESQVQFTDFKNKLNQKNHILKIQQLRNLSQKIANDQQIDTEFTYQQINHFIIVYEHINKTQRIINFDQYIDHLKTLKSHKYQQHFLIQMTKTSNHIFDDVIEELGLSQFGIPKLAIQNIVNNSKFVLSINDKQNVVVKIITIKVKSNKLKQRQQILKEYSYQKLVNFKQTSLLFMTNIQDQQNAQQHPNYIYFSFFNIFHKYIQRINEAIQKLVHYGYDPQRILPLTQNIFIIKHQSQGLQTLFIKLQQIEQKWIKYVKLCYSQSFLLSHCVGFQFNLFVKQCFSFKYNRNVFKTIDLKQLEFKSLFYQINNDQFDNNIQGFIAQINKLKQIIKPYEIQYLKNYQNAHQQQNQQTSNIIYIRCPPQSIYYQIAKMQKEMNINLNRLLFCSESISFLQLYCFVNRCLINPCGYYYIISPFKLEQNVKDQFKKMIIQLAKSDKFKQLKICFIDQQTNHIIYKILNNQKHLHIKLINEQTNQNHKYNLEILSKLLKETLIVQSSHAGLGKTFYVQKITERQNRNLKYLPIGGNINYQDLIKRIKSLNLTMMDNLLIQVGFINNPLKLQTFLAQIILFKSLYFQQFIFVPSIKIFIELQNFQKSQVFEKCHILKILKQNKNLIFLNQFKIKNIFFSNSYDQNFIFNYLHNDLQNFIGDHQLPYKSELLELSNKRKRQLVQIYFYEWFQQRDKQPTFIQYSNFKKMLFNYLKIFSLNQFFKINNINHLNIGGVNILRFRSSFVNLCIQNSLIMINQTVYVSNFIENEKNEKNQEFNQIADQLKLLIVSNQKTQSFNFAYKDDAQVPDIIKLLLVTQNYSYFNRLTQNPTLRTIKNIFAESALTKLPINQLQIKIQQFLQQFSKNPRQKLKQSQFYQLTLDNFCKICLTIQKANCNIPIIIMGQSGVGKTALIQYLVQGILQEPFFKINIHAGVQEQILKQEVKKFKLAAQSIKQSEKIWIFFDQFNTTDYQSYIKQIIMDRRFMGQKLPENIVFLAACNPYRHKKQSNQNKKELFKLKQKNNEFNSFNIQSQNLAFHVNPPSMSLIQVMWNYNQLSKVQLKFYIQKILAIINYDNKQKLIETLIFTHLQFIKNKQISSVSLRDIVRFKQIYQWFFQNMPSKEPNKIIKTRKNILTNYKINREERAIILSYIFCYIYKLSDCNDRDVMLNKVEVIFKFKKDYMKMIMANEQDDFATRIIDQNEQIALNVAVKQNIMITLVCITNRIPILLIGSPGSSKTLSINILTNHLQSQFSKNCDSEFVNKFPKLMIFYYQGSIASTSESVHSQFVKAEHFQFCKKSQNNKNTEKIFPCIIFDEIGLAERSKHNPLKVLHSKLQTNKKNICFVGVSNQELDAAKQSRFLILNRTRPDKKDLIQSAIQLNNIYSNKPQAYQNLFKLLGQTYQIFIDNWNKNKLNQKDFFGLRDFYGYIKYVGNQLKKIEQIATQNQIKSIVSYAIKLNFDGRPNSVQQFHALMSIPIVNELNSNIINTIHNNVSDPTSRNLLLIINSDTVLPIIYQNLKFNGKQRKVVVFYGSPFLQDQINQIHTVQAISLILNYVALGTNLIFVNINQNIQTSLYDLFNKNYFLVGDNKYCRTAIGANTKLRTYVHQEYNSIICVGKGKVKDLDLAFINRFEKHQFTTQNALKQYQIQMEKQIRKWLNKLLQFFKHEINIKLKSQNFILNMSKQSILSAIISERANFEDKLKKHELLKKVKITLLKNSTTDLAIAMKKYSAIDKQCEFSQLKKQCQSIKQCKNDMIIFTYDQQANIEQQNQNFALINLSQHKNQKSLKKDLKKYFFNNSILVIKIYLNYQYYYDHLNYLLFIAKELKHQCKSQKQIKIFVMMHRFSLHNLKIDHVNISYIHKFQQFFTQKIRSVDNLKQLFATKDYSQIMKIINMRIKDNLNLYITSAINFIDLKEVQIIQQEQKTKETYFKSLLTLNKNIYFKETMEVKIYQILKSKKFEYFDIIQMNDQNIRCCSNIYKAIQKIISNQIISIIVLFIKLLIQQDFLFIFTDYQAYVKQFLQSKSSIHPKLKAIILSQSHQYKTQRQQLFFQVFEKSFNKMEQRLITYQNNKINNPLAIQEQDFMVILQKRSNIILIQKRLSLIPTFNDHLPILFQIQQINVSSLESIWKNQYQNIKAISDRSDNQQNIKNEVLMMNQKYRQVMSIIKQNAFFYNLEQSQSLKILFLMDLFQFCGLQIYISTPNQLKLDSIYQIIIPHFIDLTINFQIKIIIATANKKYLNAYIELLSILQYQKNIALQNQVSSKVIHIANPFQIPKQMLNTLMKYVHKSIVQIQILNEADYLKYFKQIYLKVKQISKQINDVEVQSQIYVLANFYEFLQKIQKYLNQNYFQLIIRQSIKQNKLLELDIINFIQVHILNVIESNQQFEVVKQYLLFNFLLNQRKKEMQSYLSQYMIILNFIISFINQNDNFANSSNCFIAYVIDINSQKQLSISQFMHKSQNYLRNIIQQYPIINDNIDLQNNFSACLNNYFTLIFIKYTNQKLMESQFHNFLTYINKLENQTQFLIKIMMNVFIKIYCNYFVEAIENKQSKDKIIQINSILKQQKQNIINLRMFIFKKIVKKFQQPKLIISLIQTLQFDCFSQLLKDFELDTEIIPPNMYNSHQVLRTFHQIGNNSEIIYYIEQQIEQFNEKPESIYGLLTAFMLNYYKINKQNQQFISQLKKSLQINIILNEPKNIVIKALMLGYLQNNLSSLSAFRQRQNFKKIYHLLNYLNIIVSLKNVNHPLKEMFLYQNGLVIQQFKYWFDQRFIINSMPNPSVTRTKYLIQMKKKRNVGNSYTICSSKCDFIMPVGGQFEGKNMGCAQLNGESTCFFCKGIIGGGHGLPPKRANEGARIFAPNSLQTQLQRIYKINQFVIEDKQFKLKGYQIGNSVKQVGCYFQLWDQFQNKAMEFKTNNLSTKRIVQSIIYFVWYIFAQLNLLNMQEIQNFFHLSITEVKQFLYDASIQLDKQVLEKINIKTQSIQNMTIWHFGFAQTLFKYCLQFKDSGQDRYNQISLLNFESHNYFENQFDDKINKIYDIQREAVIHHNKASMKQMIRNNYEVGLKIPTHSKIYHDIDISMQASSQHILQYYGSYIQKKHLILSIFFRNRSYSRWLISIRNIYLFVSTLHKECNFKIHRTDANKEIKSFIIQYFKTQKKIQFMTNLFNNFIKGWKQLSDKHYQLRFQCQVLGTLQPIDQNCQLSYCLIDTEDFNNVEGRQLISLLQVTANQYNQILINLQNQILLARPQYQKHEIFNNTLLNPMNFSQNNKMLNISQKLLDDKIKMYSNYSVEDGVTNISYAFGQIESFIIQQVRGLNYFISNKQQMKKIHFIGQNQYFLQKLERSSIQKSLRQTGSENQIINWIMNQKAQRKDVFFINIKQLQTSLQHILIYYQNTKIESFADQTIQDFVNSKRIIVNAELFKNQVISKLKMQNIADLYYLIEFYSFQNVTEQLPKDYQSQQLTQNMRTEGKIMLEQMMRVQGQFSKGLPNFYIFKTAVYRLAGRNLIIQRFSKDIRMWDLLSNDHHYWSQEIRKSFYNPNFSFSECLSTVMQQIYLSHTKSFLKFLSLEEKQLI